MVTPFIFFLIQVRDRPNWNSIMADKLPVKRSLANTIDSVAKRQFILALFVLLQAYKVKLYPFLYSARLTHYMFL